MAGYDDLRARAGREARARRADGHRRLVLHRDRRRRPAQAHGHRSASAWPTAPSCACTRPARPWCGSRCRPRARATRRRSPRSSPRSSASRRRTSRSCTATPTRRRSASAPTAAARRRCPARRRRWSPARCATRRGSSPRRCSRPRRTTSSGRRAAGSSRATRSRARRSRRSRSAPHGTVELPEGVEGNLDAEVIYDPPNLTFPFGAYICVVDVDPGTGKVKVRRFIAVDDCGTRINPMIVEGQIHGGLADGVGMALMEFIAFDEDGNCLGGSFMDYLIPTLDGGARLGAGRHGHAVAAPPDRRQGHRRVARPSARRRRWSTRSSTRSRRSASATWTCRCTPARVWEAMQGRDAGVAAVSLTRAPSSQAAGVPFVRGDRRPRAAADQRAAGRPRARARPTARSTASSAAPARRRRVRLHALRALETGEPLLLRILPGAGDGRRARGGRGRRRQPVPVRRRARDLPRAAPARAAGARGRATSPVAQALARAGRRRSASRASGGARRAGDHARGRRLARAREEDARRGRAGAGVRYVGLVASRRARRRGARRAARDGVAEEASRACTRPRAWTSARARPRRSRCRSWPSSSPAAAPHRRAPAPAASRPAVDPVCGMTVAVGPRHAAAEHAAEAALLRRGLPGAPGSRMPDRPVRRRARPRRRRLAAARAAQAAAALRRRDAARRRAGDGARVRASTSCWSRSAARRDEVRDARRPRAAPTSCVNDAFGAGCSSSIAAALGALDPRCDVLVLLLGDQPGVDARRRCARCSPGARRRAARRLPLRGRPRPPVRLRARGVRRPRPRCTATRRCGSCSTARAGRRRRGGRCPGRCRATSTPGRTTRPCWRAGAVTRAARAALPRRSRRGPGRRGARRAARRATTSPTRGWPRRMFLALRLPQPLLLEGEAGVGKTEAAQGAGRRRSARRSIRLQCYEGIDASEALYEWNYPRQLLRDPAGRGARRRRSREDDLFGREYLVRRPLLEAIEHPGPLPAVLLVDELDRADDDFEAFLLELLADAARDDPRAGTIRAARPPAVVLTSNRTRDLHDALKRRCLYHWIDYPPPEREVGDRAPARAGHGAGARGGRGRRRSRRLRAADVQKPPGIAEAHRLGRGARAARRRAAGRGGGGADARLGAEVPRGPGAGARARARAAGGWRRDERARRSPARCARRAARRGCAGRALRARRAARDAGPVGRLRCAPCARADAAGRTARRARTGRRRVSVVTAREQVAAFDAVFGAVVDGLADPADARAATRRAAAVGAAAAPAAAGAGPRGRAGAGAAGAGRAPADGAGGGERPRARRVLAAAPATRSGSRDVRFDALDAAELAVAARLVRRLALRTPPRRARRARPPAPRRPSGRARDAAAQPAHRAAIRSSCCTGAAARSRAGSSRCSTSPARWRPTRGRTCCCSRARRGGARAETFVFATRLTRVTRALREGRARARARARERPRRPTGPAARGSARRCARSTTATAAAAWRATPSWCPLRRLGARRSRAASAREMERLSRLALPDRLGQPARRGAGLRAADGRDGRRAAARRRPRQRPQRRGARRQR